MPRSNAYIQVYFALCSLDKWSEPSRTGQSSLKCGLFDLEVLFRDIIRVIEDEEK
jgi:hypothetical protein